MKFYPLIFCLALVLTTLCAATTDVVTVANESALVARQSQSQGGCTGDMILHEIDVALMAVLPILTPILASAGIPNVTPFVHLILQFLESLHAFC
ncbi:hypothetical protein GLX27_000747 [Malassezia furfur]|uniref:Uncharacterized protein n=1 Tax=Malassezia furfur TaxID=55194 RepID=A0ABY8EKK3_MALFU|nr:hypothetical protein GLX27_000747 [Malassezia furfur]